jgi:hypothetical protein
MGHDIETPGEDFDEQGAGLQRCTGTIEEQERRSGAAALVIDAYRARSEIAHRAQARRIW